MTICSFVFSIFKDQQHCLQILQGNKPAYEILRGLKMLTEKFKGLSVIFFVGIKNQIMDIYMNHLLN